MTAELLRLEFRRNRLSALSAALAFLATLPVCRLVSAATGLAPHLALEAALTAWMLAGAPLAAALIGAASGAAAASAEAVDAEAPLPLSAERRAAASMAAAFLLTAAFAAFLLAASSLLGVAVERVLSTHEKNWGRSFWYSLEVSPLLAAVCLDALAGAWALSRLVGNGVAGGLLALAATAVSLLAVAFSFGLEVEHHRWGVHALTAACVVAGAGIPTKAAAGAAAARARERRSGAAGLALALALVAAGPALSWIPLLRELSALNGRLRLAEPAVVRWYQSRDERFPRGARAPAAAGEELAFETVRGGLVGAGPRGTRVLVPETDSGLGGLLYDPYRAYLRHVLRDGRGRLWVERWARPDVELWRVDGGRADLRRVPDGDGGSTSLVGGAPAKHRFFDGRTESLARLDDYFERGDRARWLQGIRAFAAEAARAGGAALPACGGRCLTAGGRTWSLPGRALWPDPVLPDELARGRVYLVPVRTAKGPAVAACLPDGTTVVAWPLRRIPGGTPGYRVLPDGTPYAFGPERTLWSLGPDGRPRRPVPLAAARRSLPPGDGEFPDVLRVDAGGAWLAWRGRLIVVDADGRTTRAVPLPDGAGSAVAMKDGFAALSERRAYFVPWDGPARPLLKP